MFFGHKTSRRQPILIQSASRQFIDFVAESAVKMVVMVLVRSFIKRPTGRVVDFPEPALLD